METTLTSVAAGLPLLADLQRADVLLYQLRADERLCLVAQAAPHSVPPIHVKSQLGVMVDPQAQPALVQALNRANPAVKARRMQAHRAQIVQSAYPIFHDGTIVGVLSIEKSLVEHERHQVRRWPFRRALIELLEMVLRGETAGLAGMSPFGEEDGIMLVADTGEILYLSGLGSYHYRRLGYSEELVGKHVVQLDTLDQDLVRRALEQGAPFEHQAHEQDRIWERKVIPICGPRVRTRWRPSLALGPNAWKVVLITIHDATGARRKAEEQAVRQAMVQEIHHRVKNNLQTLASLMRIQARRATHDETRQLLGENINRILSFAVVHEFLSQHEGQTINLRDVASRILTQVQQGALDPGKDIRFRVEGPQIFLSAHQTTICALVINELLLNALEHAFEARERGEVAVILQDEGDRVILQVNDTGEGLPPNFNVDETSSLGLRIVRTVVQQDMRGTFDLTNNGGGASAIVTFPKAAPETFG